MATKKKASSELSKALGRLGGEARAKSLSKKQRSDAARRAVQARWRRAKKGGGG
jgi:hypothetical protein